MDGWEGLDIGPETAKLFADAVKLLKPLYGTDRWMLLEMPNLHRNQQLQQHYETDAVTISGGDSAAAVNQLDMAIR